MRSLPWQSLPARGLRKVRAKVRDRVISHRLRGRTYNRLWIDVGAHEGELTIREAALDPHLLVYAFEPNVAVALRSMGRLPNFVVIPMAVAGSDGSAELHLNAFEASSSLLPVDEEGAQRWVSDAPMGVVGSTIVSTIRLDTFMDAARISRIEFLKVDAQGMDLEVVKSAGARLDDIEMVQLEVTISPSHYYVGDPSREEVMEFMTSRGFALVSEGIQSHGQESNLTFKRRGRSRPG